MDYVGIVMRPRSTNTVWRAIDALGCHALLSGYFESLTMRYLSGVGGGGRKRKLTIKLSVVALSANKLIDTEGRKGEKLLCDVKGASRTVPRRTFSEKLIVSFRFRTNKLTTLQSPYQSTPCHHSFFAGRNVSRLLA